MGASCPSFADRLCSLGFEEHDLDMTLLLNPIPHFMLSQPASSQIGLLARQRRKYSEPSLQKLLTWGVDKVNNKRSE